MRYDQTFLLSRLAPIFWPLPSASIKTIHARPGIKALIWSSVDVVQPQEFLSLWIITFETDERIPIAESIKDEQRVYEHYLRDIVHQLQIVR